MDTAGRTHISDYMDSHFFHVSQKVQSLTTDSGDTLSGFGHESSQSQTFLVLVELSHSFALPSLDPGNKGFFLQGALRRQEANTWQNKANMTMRQVFFIMLKQIRINIDIREREREDTLLPKDKDIKPTLGSFFF